MKCSGLNTNAVCDIEIKDFFFVSSGFAESLMNLNEMEFLFRYLYLLLSLLMKFIFRIIGVGAVREVAAMFKNDILFSNFCIQVYTKF